MAEQGTRVCLSGSCYPSSAAEGEAVIVIDRKAQLIRSGGMKDKSIQNTLEIVQDNAGMLAEAWETMHGA